MSDYIRKNVNRPRLMEILMGQPKYFLRKAPKKEEKKGRNYHVREKYETYSSDKIIEIVNVCADLSYYAGVIDTLKELSGHGDLEKNLRDASKQAKIVLPKKIYDNPEIQQNIKKIKQGLKYFKN